MSICSLGSAEKQPVFKSYKDAYAYVKENHPEELDLGTVTYKPTDLYKIKQEMGEDKILHFETTWHKMNLTENTEEIDLNVLDNLAPENIEAYIQICPAVKKITLTKHYTIKNEKIIEYMEKYPDIEFVWMVQIKGRYRLPSNCTAYSTMNNPNAEGKLQSEDLEVLKYVPGLKALDVGHNKITTLDWLKYCPDLEFLILGDNKGITDITPIGNLKHLQYLELFTTGVEDITPLSNCTEMIDLNLSYCKKLTDITPLDTMHKLERFWGNHMDGLSEEAKEEFAKTHKNTHCVFKGVHATSEGWREHERYDHYIKCLKTRVWIPFETKE